MQCPNPEFRKLHTFLCSPYSSILTLIIPLKVKRFQEERVRTCCWLRSGFRQAGRAESSQLRAPRRGGHPWAAQPCPWQQCWQSHGMWLSLDSGTARDESLIFSSPPPLWDKNGVAFAQEVTLGDNNCSPASPVLSKTSTEGTRDAQTPSVQETFNEPKG